MIINTIKESKKKEKTYLGLETCRVSSPIAVARPLAPRRTLRRSVALAVLWRDVGGGCCHYWVAPWGFYCCVVPVHVVNCKNIVNKAKKEKHTWGPMQMHLEPLFLLLLMSQPLLSSLVVVDHDVESSLMLISHGRVDHMILLSYDTG